VFRLIEYDNKSKLLNLLVAYPYLKKEIINFVKDNNGKIRFLLDSGAFTAWKAGKPIKLDDYCRFIEELPFKPWRYFTLDVIGNPSETIKNYDTMLRRGFNPVPIFTRGEDVSVLDEFYKTSDVVGIGGLVGTPENKGFVNGIMKYANGRRVHWLGFTNMNFIKHYKPYMCDSSSWESGGRFGSATLYFGHGKSKQINKSCFIKKPSKEICDAISYYGIDAKDFSKQENNVGVYSAIRRIGGYSVARLSLDIQNKLETLMFSAATSNLANQILIEGYNMEVRRYK